MLVQEGSGEPATDACGIVAAFKQGEPSVYTYRTFTGASFDLPVTEGTYRVAVIPNLNLPVGGISLPAYRIPMKEVKGHGRRLRSARSCR